MTSAVVATSSHADPLADSLPAGRRLDKARFRWSSLPLLIPGLGLLAVLFVGPVLYSLYLGFTNLELVGPTAQHYQFTGLTNVKRLIHDPVFHQSIVLTLIFVLGSAVVGATLVGLALALALRSSLALVRAVVGGIVVVSVSRQWSSRLPGMQRALPAARIRSWRLTKTPTSSIPIRLSSSAPPTRGTSRVLR